jgi:CheY-like chemotaxis protein
MPEMDGTEALHRIRASEGGASKDSPVICLTADAVVGAKARYLAEGFSDYLSKPVDSYALEKMLMRHLPKAKVERVRAEQAPAEPDASAPEDGFSSLRAAGVDPEIGLRYCRNDEALYRSLLAEYARSHEEKAEALRKCLTAENWQDYAIYAHAVKSSSRMIGAVALSELAAALEEAANAGDEETVLAKHAFLMDSYDALSREIDPAIPSQDLSEDEPILEFSPEEDGVPDFPPDGG